MILIRVRLTHMLEVKLVHNWTVLPQNLFHLKYLVHFLRQNSSFILVSYLIWKNYCLIFEFFLDFPLLLLPAYYLHFVNPLVQFPFLPVPQIRTHSRQIHFISSIDEQSIGFKRFVVGISSPECYFIDFDFLDWKSLWFFYCLYSRVFFSFYFKLLIN